MCFVVAYKTRNGKWFLKIKIKKVINILWRSMAQSDRTSRERPTPNWTCHFVPNCATNGKTFLFPFYFL